MGIGAAIAEQLARDGMTVLVSDINMEEAEKTAGRFRDEGLRPRPCNSTSGSLPRLTPRSTKLQRRMVAAT